MDEEGNRVTFEVSSVWTPISARSFQWLGVPTTNYQKEGAMEHFTFSYKTFYRLKMSNS